MSARRCALGKTWVNGVENEGLRRLLVSAAYWAAGLETQIPAKADVDYVGEYKPNWFGFGKSNRG